MDQIRKNEIIAVMLFAVGVLLFLSLFTFSQQDLSFYTSNPNVVIRNATGIAGAYLGGILLFLIGKASYVIPVLIIVWGVSRLIQHEHRRVFFKIFGAIVLTAAVSASLSAMSDTTRAASFEQGGLIGSLVASFLNEYLGRLGAGVFIAALIVLSLLIATEFLILPLIVSAVKALRAVPASLKDKLASEAAEAEVPRPKRSARIKQAKEEVARKLAAMKSQSEDMRRTSLAREAAGSGKKTSGAKEGPTQAPAKKSARGAGPKIVQAKATKKVADEGPRTAPFEDRFSGKDMNYKMPAFSLLKDAPPSDSRDNAEDLKQKAETLETTLMEFGVEAKVVKINRGPVITMYELEPAVGTKVNKITSLVDNISLAMRSSNIRIVAPLPGKGTIGIEVPNDKSELVTLKEILESEEFAGMSSPLKLALGKDITGIPIVTDLAKMPHLLIAGATGAGKTVCINCIISSLLYNSTPDKIKFMMIDPKRVELMPFQGIPHLVLPVVTNPKKAAPALNWVISEMERRYEVFAEKGVRNIASYYERQEDDDETMPYIVVVVDELADLMMVAQQDIEAAIMRIAQLSRAAGIHMILATQRPSVNVITGVIKANLPSRISFKVSSKVDSRTVLDANGAEKLLGRGDMLFMAPGSADLIRGQCCLVMDDEIRDLVKFIKEQAEPQYIEDAVATQENQKKVGVDQEKDEMYQQALEIVLQTRQASVSMIQRKLRVGYTRAARMVDIMEEEGVVGPYNGSKPREILIEDLEDLDLEGAEEA